MNPKQVQRTYGWIKSAFKHGLQQASVELRIKGKKKFDCGAVYQVPSAIESLFLDSSPVFFLSTGRAGSAYVTHLLSGIKDIWVEHEATPVLMTSFNDVFYEFRSDPRGQGHVFKAARYEKMLRYFLAGYRYVESNHVLTALADGIVDVFKNARFVIVTRDPSTFACSALMKGWFINDTIWENSRVGHKYECQSRIEKIITYWTEMNSRLAHVIDTYPKQSIWFRFEDLVTKTDSVADLLTFAGLEFSGSDKRLSKVVKNPVNKNRENYWDHEGIMKSSSVDLSAVEEFLCGLPENSATHKMMRRFGYETKP